MRWVRQMLAVTTLLAAVSVATESRAGSIQRGVSNPNVSIQTIVEFGNNVQPVTIVENSKINIARVIEIGGASSTVDATIVQNGITNIVNVIQVGGTTNALIGQSGVNNIASITQVGNSTNALLLQIGNMNTGTVRQFGHFNWAAIFQFGR